MVGQPVATAMIEGTVSALRYRYESNPLEVTIQPEQGTAHDEGNYSVPVLVRIPLGKLVLLPREQIHVANVRVFLSVMDESGRTSDVQQAYVPIEIPADEVEEALGKFYTYEARLLMRPGRHAIAVGVRDEIGAVSSFVTGGVTVGPSSTASADA